MNEERDETWSRARESGTTSANECDIDAVWPKVVMGVCVSVRQGVLPTVDDIDGVGSEILIGMTGSRRLGHPVDAVALVVDRVVLNDVVLVSRLRKVVRIAAGECPVRWINSTVADRAAEAFRFEPGMDDDIRKAAGVAQAVLDSRG